MVNPLEGQFACKHFWVVAWKWIWRLKSHNHRKHLTSNSPRRYFPLNIHILSGWWWIIAFETFRFFAQYFRCGRLFGAFGQCRGGCVHWSRFFHFNDGDKTGRRRRLIVIHFRFNCHLWCLYILLRHLRWQFLNALMCTMFAIHSFDAISNRGYWRIVIACWVSFFVDRNFRLFEILPVATLRLRTNEKRKKNNFLLNTRIPITCRFALSIQYYCDKQRGIYESLAKHIRTSFVYTMTIWWTVFFASMFCNLIWRDKCICHWAVMREPIQYFRKWNA